MPHDKIAVMRKELGQLLQNTTDDKTLRVELWKRRSTPPPTDDFPYEGYRELLEYTVETMDEMFASRARYEEDDRKEALLRAQDPNYVKKFTIPW